MRSINNTDIDLRKDIIKPTLKDYHEYIVQPLYDNYDSKEQNINKLCQKLDKELRDSLQYGGDAWLQEDNSNDLGPIKRSLINITRVYCLGYGSVSLSQINNIVNKSIDDYIDCIRTQFKNIDKEPKNNKNDRNEHKELTLREKIKKLAQKQYLMLYPLNNDNRNPKKQNNK